MSPLHPLSVIIICRARAHTRTCALPPLNTRFDGYAGPAVVSFSSTFLEEFYCTNSSNIVDPQVAESFKHRSRPSNDKENAATLDNPTWKWDDRDIFDMFPLGGDCEWLATQSISAVIRKGTSVEGPILGQCEIPLAIAFEKLIRDDDVGEEVLSDDDDDEEYGALRNTDASVSTTIGFAKKQQRRSTETAEEADDGKTPGGDFRVHALKSGKYIGDLTGKISMTVIPGIDQNEDDYEINDKVAKLEGTILGLKQKRVERMVNEKASPEAEKAVAVKPRARRETHTQPHEVGHNTIEHKTERCQVAAEGGEEAEGGPLGVSKLALEEEDYVEEPVLLRLGGKVKLPADDANESDNEDDEEDVGEDEENIGPEAWLDGDEVLSRAGGRWPKRDFVCQVTNVNLVNSNFILKDGKPYSKVGYLQKFALNKLCAHCLKRCKKTEDCVLALGFKWHAEHLKCAHSGKKLPIEDEFYVKDSLPYEKDVYFEQFHTCPRCLSIVHMSGEAKDDEKGLQALGQVWHRGCFRCDSCDVDLSGSKFCSRQNDDDGRGLMPYCEDCYKEKFMPRCMSCKDYVLLEGDEEVYEACGGYWHPKCFKCAATGVLLREEFYSHEGMPYCPDSYFEMFGEKCTKCGDVIRGKMVEIQNRKWHLECFVCTGNGKPIPKNEDGNFVFCLHELMPYCNEEYSRLFGETCPGCGETVPDGEGVGYWDTTWHRSCLKCVGCGSMVSDLAEVFQGPKDGMPYCRGCYGREFGKICEACHFPINPNEDSVEEEALGKVFHESCFCCVRCSKRLSYKDGNYVNYSGFPFCAECCEEYLLDRCWGCEAPIMQEEKVVSFAEDEKTKATPTYHASCLNCAVKGHSLQDEKYFLVEGILHSEAAYAEVYAEEMCSGCGEGITGAFEKSLGKSWHPGCMICCSCDAPAAFPRSEPGMSGGEWPVCKTHMMHRFDELSEIARKKMAGEVWNNWKERQEEARRLSCEKIKRKDELVKQKEKRENDVKVALDKPYPGFEQKMREALGINKISSGKQGVEEGSSDNEDDDTNHNEGESGQTESWVELKDADGYTYYWNRTTDVTTYDVPNGSESHPQPSVEKTIKTKDGSTWFVHHSIDGELYYENGETGETSWEAPPGIISDDDPIDLSDLTLEEKAQSRDDIAGEEDGGGKEEEEIVAEEEEEEEEEEEDDNDSTEDMRYKEDNAESIFERAGTMGKEERAKIAKRASEWVQRVDSGSQHVYFENTAKRLTQWEKPEILSLQEAIKKRETMDHNFATTEQVPCMTAHACMHERSCIMSGTLRKKGGGKSIFGRRNWHSRYFEIRNSELMYWASEVDANKRKEPLKHCKMNLLGCKVSRMDSNEKYEHLYPFKLATYDTSTKELHREMDLQAFTAKARNEWIAAFEEVSDLVV